MPAVLVFLQFVSHTQCLTSPIEPFATYPNATELMDDVADLWWAVNDVQTEITFELHVKTTGWIALGFALGKCSSEIINVESDSGRYFSDKDLIETGHFFEKEEACSIQKVQIFHFIVLVADGASEDADMAIGWIDTNGKLYLEVRWCATEPFESFLLVNNRIDMLPVSYYRLKTRQLKIGLVCKVEKKIIGRLFSSSVH